jgi:hypothetical protein
LITFLGSDLEIKKRMRHRNLSYSAAILLVLLPLLTACGTVKNVSHSLLIPVGRTSVVGGNSFQVLIDNELYDPRVTDDNYGGYWVEIPFDPQVNSEVLLQITVRDEPGELYREKSENLQKWLNPSELIDSDDPALIAVAETLTLDDNTALEKAQHIQRFVIGYLEFRNFMNHFSYKASDTYEMGYGTCVNYARLFVALCRAAHVPARTVWGIIYNNGVYDHHHEWAEFLDDDGYWHPLDLTFTTSFEVSDIRYLDLIYASEENPLYEQSRSERYSANLSQIIVFDTTEKAFDGRLGFKLVNDNYPNSFIVEHLFKLSDIPTLVPQKVP